MSSEVKKRSGKSAKSKKPSAIISEESLQPKDTPSTNLKSSDIKKDGDDTPGDPPPKFGPMPKVSQHRIWSRSALILGLMTVVWYNSGKKNETPFAKVDEEIRFRGMKTKCSPNFEKNIAKFSACVPNHCGRIITDELVSPEELYALNDLVSRGFKEAKQDAAATVFDLSSGILKFNDKSVDVYKLNKTKSIFEHGDLLIFQSVKAKLMRMVSSYFGVDYWSIYLTSPTFFTKLTQRRAKTKSDEYWHLTVHQDLYGTFDYTAILYLSDLQKDFEGGRLIFTDGDNTNRTIDPRKGRAVAFTSGEESRHYNERVSKGTRYALTMGFTCDSSKAKKDPPL